MTSVESSEAADRGVRELVERMDGRLTVESESGRGSRFSVVLPVRA